MTITESLTSIARWVQEQLLRQGDLESSLDLGEAADLPNISKTS